MREPSAQAARGPSPQVRAGPVSGPGEQDPRPRIGAAQRASARAVEDTAPVAQVGPTVVAGAAVAAQGRRRRRIGRGGPQRRDRRARAPRRVGMAEVDPQISAATQS